jgi:acetoin utilization deacetylase AcuC-like enzyme
VTTGLVFDERFLAHRAPYDHPEHFGRLSAIWRRCVEEGLVERCHRVPAREASAEELERVHTADHIAAIASTRAATTSTPSPPRRPPAFGCSSKCHHAVMMV